MIGVYLMIIIVVCGSTRGDDDQREKTLLELNNDFSTCRYTLPYTLFNIFFHPMEQIRNEGGFFLKFNVKARANVKVLFSQENNFTKFNEDDEDDGNCIENENCTEVVIASGPDSGVSSIGNGTNKRIHHEINLLSNKEWRQFWIRITSDGSLIEVGKNSSPPFMAYRMQPWIINYYGMRGSSQYAYYKNPISYAYLCFENNSIDLSQYRTLTTYDDVYTFYSIEDIKYDEGFLLKFMVKADQDAYIIFSPKKETVKKDERVFKVILGGYTTNTISVIKTTELAEPASSHYDKDILSPDEWRSFWIRITQDGASIQVGKNASSAFMSLKTEPTPIKYYGFANSGSFANWALPSLKDNKKVTNVCIPSPCGPNSKCKQKDNHAICSCYKNQLDSPSTCRFECIFHSECPQNKACIGKTCQDPCAGMSGKNATCEVDNHAPIYSCKRGFTGDPLAGCVKEEEYLPKYRSLTTHTGATLYPISVMKNDNQILQFNVKTEKAAEIMFLSTNPLEKKDVVQSYSVNFHSKESKISFDSGPRSSTMTYSEYNLLSSTEWRPFWIRITSDGSLIEIGKNIGELPFISLKKDPWPIKYFLVGGNADVCHWNFVSSKDTNIDLLRYRTHISGSANSTLFPIADINNNHDEYFLEFNLKTKHSARIIFTEKNDPEISFILKNHPKYQDLDIFLVVIEDTHLSIRTTPAGEEQARYDEENLISSEEWRLFWIRITTDGSSIEVGKNGGRVAFLKTKPRIIKYFGFSSAGNTAQWAFPPQIAKVLVFL